MRPSEVRQRVLHDHERLRHALDGLEDLARCVAEGTEGSLDFASDLRDAGEVLLESLERHMAWEDRHLAPALLEADAWGEERVKHLAEDHREQREVLRHTLSALADPGRPALVLARTLLDFVTLLRDDMDSEERLQLDPSVLRDDVIAIDAEDG
jgi:iron-sulfur cluster repair protein YtfE (RIC family)